MANYPLSLDDSSSLLKQSNNSRTTSTNQIDAGDTAPFVISAVDGSNFPLDNFLVTISGEIFLISIRSGDDFTVVARAQENTVAATHAIGSFVSNVYTANSREVIKQSIIDGQTYLFNERGLSISNVIADPSTITPAEGDQYIVADSAIGDWTGQDENLAIYNGATWDFVVPSEGWLVYDIADGRALRFRSGQWTQNPGNTTVFSSLNTYRIDDQVSHLGTLYIAVLDNGPGAFNLADWDELLVLVAGVGNLQILNNLSDVADAPTSLANLGGETAFSKSTAFNKDFGTTAGTVLEGDTVVSSVESIDDLSDVDTTTTPPIADDFLRFDGVNWVPHAVVNLVLANVAVSEGLSFTRHNFTDANVTTNDLTWTTLTAGDAALINYTGTLNLTIDAIELPTDDGHMLTITHSGATGRLRIRSNQGSGATFKEIGNISNNYDVSSVRGGVTLVYNTAANKWLRI